MGSGVVSQWGRALGREGEGGDQLTSVDAGQSGQMVVSMTTLGPSLVSPARGDRQAPHRALSVTYEDSQRALSRPWEVHGTFGRRAG